ncbi:MAG: peptidyl-prolyl cis-trans isomerase [Armatimonadetes bacterium]|nr:peptidyl-prolyl cis-trans isomerase [Armatimonadota bacterium]MDE2207085.1 peptidyl-prolyl cis-trans isomerase [Armatimonadota bacterium]
MFRLSSRIPAALLCASALAALTGCQGEKIIARVNNRAITYDEYVPQLMRVGTIPAGANLDAGGVALINVVKSELVDQLAAQRHAVPSAEDIAKYATYFTSRNPTLQDQLKTGQLSQSGLDRQIKTEWEQLGIGTDGAHVDASEIAQYYKGHSAQLAIPEMWTIRTMPVGSLAIGTQVLPQLRQSGDFKAAAAAAGLPAAAASLVGQTSVIDSTTAPPNLQAALAHLTPGQFAAAPIEISVPAQNGGAPQTVYVLAQMVSTTPSRIPSLDEVSMALDQQLLQQKFPNWVQHATDEIGTFARSSTIRIYIDRYQPLVSTYIVPPETSAVSVAPQAPPKQIAVPHK